MSEIIGWDIGAEDIVGDDSGAVQAKNLPQNFAATPVHASLAAAGTVTLELTPLRVIRPDRIVFDRVKALSLVLTDVKIGTVSLNASTGACPADAFSPDAQGTAMRCPVQASPSLHIFFTITNPTAVAVTNISIGIIGPSLTPNG